MTALHLAVAHNHLEGVKWLVEHGASLMAKSNDGNTALHYTASKGQFELVQWLVSHGAVLTEKNIFGETALHLAARYGHFTTAQFLAEKGKWNLLSIKNNNKETAYDVARKDDVKKLLGRLEKKFTPPFYERWFQKSSVSSSASSDNKSSLLKPKDIALPLDSRNDSECDLDLSHVSSSSKKTDFSVKPDYLRSADRLIKQHRLMDRGIERVFSEYEVKGDGNCGFTALGVDRKEAVSLLKNLGADNLEKRGAIIDELLQGIENNRSAHSEEIDPTCYMDQAIRSRINELFETLRIRRNHCLSLCEKVRNLLGKNNMTLPGGNTDENIFTSIKNNTLPIALNEESKTEFLTSYQKRNDILNEVRKDEGIFNAYINSYDRGNNQGLWLGEESMRYIAQAKGIGLVIWGVNRKIDQLQMRLPSIEASSGKNTVNIILRPGHYNFLVENSVEEKMTLKRSHMRDSSFEKPDESGQLTLSQNSDLAGDWYFVAQLKDNSENSTISSSMGVGEEKSKNPSSRHYVSSVVGFSSTVGMMSGLSPSSHSSRRISNSSNPQTPHSQGMTASSLLDEKSSQSSSYRPPLSSHSHVSSSSGSIASTSSIDSYNFSGARLLPSEGSNLSSATQDNHGSSNNAGFFSTTTSSSRDRADKPTHISGFWERTAQTFKKFL